MAPADAVRVRARQLLRTLHYDGDNAALLEINKRLADFGRREDVVTYSALVKGIVFHLPNVNGGRGFELGVPDWSDLHRAIIGECLGHVSCDTYEMGRFLGSAVAVSAMTFEPSDGFRSLLEKLGLVASKRDRCTEVWIDQLRRSYAWYKANPAWPET